ncbi:MAG: twin-arginine translocase subunit TatC [Phycisphaerae bacterium]
MPFWNRPDRHPHPDEVRMTLGEHLEELRTRLVRALVAMAVGAIACWVFRGYAMWLLTRPVYAALDKHEMPRDLYQLTAEGPFVLEFKIMFLVGFVITAPYGLAQLWGFVAAGLYPTERRWVRRFVPVSIALFFIGAFFMLFVVAPVMMDFFIGYRKEYPDPTEWLPDALKPAPTLIQTTLPPATQPAWPTSMPAFTKDPPHPPEGTLWLNQAAHEIRVRFGEKVYSLGPLTPASKGNRVIPLLSLPESVILILQMMAAFGIGFQMPVVVSLLTIIGIAEARDMARLRRHVYFVIAIASAVITPSPDVFSMMALMIPMVALFEVGLLAARFIERERAKTT